MFNPEVFFDQLNLLLPNAKNGLQVKMSSLVTENIRPSVAEAVLFTLCVLCVMCVYCMYVLYVLYAICIVSIPQAHIPCVCDIQADFSQRAQNLVQSFYSTSRKARTCVRY